MGCDGGTTGKLLVCGGLVWFGLVWAEKGVKLLIFYEWHQFVHSLFISLSVLSRSYQEKKTKNKKRTKAKREREAW